MILLPPAVIIASPARCPPPPTVIVAGGRPLAVQLLVRASRRPGLLREAMQARDVSVDSARAYALMPPDEADMEGAWVRWRDAAAGGARANWATCLRLLECATAAADAACNGVALTTASPTLT